ncbi:MAG: hypothetical protein U0T33_04255 [Bacteroidales bacterium]
MQYLFTLIVTGISMQYTGRDDSTYMVGFAKAVKWHNWAAFLLTANYVFYILGNAFTNNGDYYHIRRKDFVKDLVKQMKYYAFGMFKGEKHPFPVSLENSILSRNFHMSWQCISGCRCL